MFSKVEKDRPCLIYGLRGVIYFSITSEKPVVCVFVLFFFFFGGSNLFGTIVSGPQKSNHSGVDGGAFREPMLDLLQIVSSLCDPCSGRVNVPGFYDQVRPVTDEEVCVCLFVLF